MGTSEITKDFILPFSIYEGVLERNDCEVVYELTKLVKKNLQDSNWRLMTEGINFRLGFLTGHLRAYEREEDLLVLIR